MNKKYKITIVGAGYVGLSSACILGLNNSVKILDIDQIKINKINKNICPIADNGIEDYFFKNILDIEALTDKKIAYKRSDYIVIATPTNFIETKKNFDTTSVEKAISDSISINPTALIIIKSTVPIGFTESQCIKHNTNKIIFSPEFLEEGDALGGMISGSRLIFGGHNSQELHTFIELLKDSSSRKLNTEILFMSSKEAEAVKLFSNTYLAMRVSFFNELDSFAIRNKIDPKNIIDGVCKDYRIQDFYNNPSFGYGGYCLPKDTKQLLTDYNDTPQNLIGSIVKSNQTRKEFIVNDILAKGKKNIGIYRLNMKKNSDNFRNSSVLEIIRMLHKKDLNIFIYEPLINLDSYNKIPIIKDLNSFKINSDIIIANRANKELDDVKIKVYTRDIFNKN